PPARRQPAVPPHAARFPSPLQAAHAGPLHAVVARTAGGRAGAGPRTADPLAHLRRLHRPAHQVLAVRPAPGPAKPQAANWTTMLSPFFILAAQSPSRQHAFRTLVVVHLCLLLVAAWLVAVSDPVRTAPYLGHLLLIAGIVEGAVLLGWRLTQ